MHHACMHAFRDACTHACTRACMQDDVCGEERKQRWGGVGVDAPMHTSKQDDVTCVVKTTGSVGLGVGVEEDAT
jgi:hypothetical protein